MASEEIKQNLYELAYFISPQIKEDEIVSHINKIKGLITSKKSEVAKEEIPHQRRLAYPIGRHKEGFFGYFHFSSSPKSVREISDALTLDSSVLRHLLITVTTKQSAQMKKSTQSVSAQEKVKKMMHKAKEEESIFKKEDAVSHLEEHKVELEELDKKLEEILNK